ncbi:hypothetical protein [Salinimicrobium sp. WS361]|uniref:hypothetical protein n=1 Tax=Salinimicrobium sp. WS361 TaxID=3425123 RepID=UPI003D6F0292
MTTSNSMREIGRQIKKLLPPDHQFTVVIFPKSGKGFGTYISSAPMEESAMAMRETAGKLERRELLPTLENN